jgi:hypothetical protein
VLAGRIAAGSATLAPPVLSHQPCVVMLAMLPTLVVLIALAVGRYAAIRDRTGN